MEFMEDVMSRLEYSNEEDFEYELDNLIESYMFDYDLSEKEIIRIMRNKIENMELVE